MEALFAPFEAVWDFLVWLLVPKRALVLYTEAGVKFKHGRFERVDPGMHWYWEVTTEILTTETTWRVSRLPKQTLTTKDGQTVVAGGLLVWRVEDVAKFLTEIEDGDSAVEDVGLTGIRKVVVNQPLDKLQSTFRDVVDNALKNEIEEALSDYGVKVDIARLTDFAPARVLNLVHSQGEDEIVEEVED